MRIVIAGGHGQIALLLSRRLADAGHQPVGLIRNPEQADDVRVAGAEPVVLDLEQSSVDEIGLALDGADAVVFAAGGGPNSGAARKLTVDRDGAVLLARAAETAGVRRYVMISALAADDYDRDAADVETGEVFQVYLRAKAEADEAVRASELDWTVLRPGGLTDDPGTGRVRLAERTGRGTIPRADVAALVAACLTDGLAVGVQVEAVSGDTPIGEALAALG
ncbi:uncharacterized protein YbjT (DUF2867 family) [Friedmanniella endophytica]|uniref:Uncharacterized protein YbjT (DUF2867 family) n=1 Tax=Microlunatus kandeliicorticis TaxID=1759536 RepID=A0A7W3IUG1_9ACTN|nr:SDR family oxidoreductase [Microlunatus kandeliicorticis]MBA8795501.1 uncharacterized protein YbjT (DUF2867 family) [Microlunatus kandeliicorticis]